VYLKAKIFAIFMCLGLVSYGQSFTYAFKDPCDGNTKTVVVPTGQNTIAVTYFNQIKTFTVDDFSNGTFESWVNSTYIQYKDLSPCTGVGFTKTVAQNQSMAITLTGIINTIANLSFPDPNAPDPNEPEPTPEITENEPQSNQSNNNSSETNENNDQSSSGGSNSSNNNNNNKSDGGQNSSSNDQESSSEGSSDVMSGTQNSVKSSGGEGGSNGKSSSNNNKSNAQKQNALKPTIVGSSDLVAFNSTDKTKGGKVSGGYTSTRWDGARTSGILFDYSSQIKGPNITGFYGFIKKKSTTLISNTFSVGFEGKGAMYNSIAIGQLRNFSGLKVVYLAAGSYGHIYKQKLIGTSIISGFMYDFKVGKVIGVKLTSLVVYSPYMQYYNDMLLKSPFVILPSIGTNLSISKSFKFNMNLGGAYQVKSGALNYTLTIGTRLAL
jgi:hypothetical protein